MKQQSKAFKKGDKVRFRFSKYMNEWTVIVAKPDVVGRIVLRNLYDKYSLAYQTDLEAVQ